MFIINSNKVVHGKAVIDPKETLRYFNFQSSLTLLVCDPFGLLLVCFWFAFGFLLVCDPFGFSFWFF